MIEKRCASDGTACEEVTARVEKAHVVKYLEDCEHHAQQLLEVARRIADVHRQENELREGG